MSQAKKCPECGAAVRPDAPQGCCPACLVRLGAEGLLPPGEFQIRASGGLISTRTAYTPPVFPLLFGAYELLGEIGRGGMGVVYRARQVALNRVVALKLLLHGRFSDPAFLDRFHLEAEAAAHLDHPNIVPIYEIGVHEAQPYYSMRLIDGRSLEQLIAECRVRNNEGNEGRMRTAEWLRRSAELVATVARAAHYAHQHGVLHRDIKPQNILLDAAGDSYLTDFGLAKLLNQDSGLTVSAAVIGSPGFMAPEQAAGKPRGVTTAADIYGLGAVLYAMLSGNAVFQADTPLETLRQVIEQEPVPPRALNPVVDRDLETICLKCLQKEPAKRYTSARALAEDLEGWLRAEPIQARRATQVERLWLWCRRRPVRASLVGALVLVFALGLTGVLWQLNVAQEARRVAEDSERVAETARSNMVERLWAANLAEARANRWSGRPGRRFASLEAIRQAATIRPTLELRSEAIACLALADARVHRVMPSGSSRPLLALAFNSDFKQYAYLAEDRNVRILPVDLSVSGAPPYAEEVLTNKEALGTTTTLVFSPRGRFLAQSSLHQTSITHTVWDRADGRVLVWTNLRSLCFTPDEKQALTSERNGRIRLYDLESKIEVDNLSLAPEIAQLAFDPAGKRLAVSRVGNPSAVVLDLQSKTICATLTNAGSIGAPAWSPDGKVLACPSSDTRVYLWNVATGERKELRGHTGDAVAAVYNHLGDMLVSQGWDGTTWFWDAKLGLPLISIPGWWLQDGFDPNDRFLGFGMYGMKGTEYGIWEIEPARECRRLGQTARLWDAAFSANGQVLASASSDGIRLWQVESNLMLAHLPMDEARSVAWGPGDTNLVACGWQGLRRWAIGLSSGINEIRTGSAQMLSSAGREQARLTPDGGWVVSAGPLGGDALILYLEDPEHAQRLNGHAKAAFVSVSPDGKWFATGTWKGQNVKVWNMESRQPVKELPVKGSARCAFSADGRWLVTGGTEEYVFWKVDTWERGLTVSREQVSDLYGAMAISDDGRMAALLIGRNRGVKLISLPDGHELATLDTGEPLCFSRHGNRLATMGEDRQTLLVWDLPLIRRQLRALGLDWN